MAPRDSDIDGTDWLVGGGEMARAIKTKDWSKNKLGPIQSWPQSLRTVVSLMQASNSPISLVWGPGHVQIYNDGYWPICGDKHPTSMGQDFRECWAAPWPVIGAAYATAWSGKTSYLEKMRMFLERYGFLEETWFTFSFSPITDESGAVAGLFHPVTEMTSQMLSERRAKTLRDLASRTGKARTSVEAFTVCGQVLAESELDLPFTLIYLLEPDGRHGRLVGQTGVPAGGRVSPDSIDLDAAEGQLWNVAKVARTGAVQQNDDVATVLRGMAVGPYPELPKMAVSLPITQPGTDRPAAVLIAGVSARLPMTDSYRGFYDLVAAAVGTALANARAYEEERRRAEMLAEIDRAKTAFFSNVSHEFRTPLTLMLGPIEDELNEAASPLPKPRRDRLATAHRNCLRLLKLVNTLLDFSRIEAGRIEASYEPTDLATTTAELASVFRSAFEKADLVLTVDCPPLPDPIYVDREMWEKIVLNLLSNALKHTFHGGVTVSLRAADGDVEKVTLRVVDTGIGIRAEELPRLFERFHRVQGAQSRSYEGTGIGLALVHDLVALHGGTVQVESREGKGSTFIVTVPKGVAHLSAERIGKRRTSGSTAARAEAYVEEALNWLPADSISTSAAVPQLSPSAADLPAPRGQAADLPKLRPRIIWADDNADMRDYVRRLLADAYDVCAVSDGLAAVAAAREAPPDLVLTDVMMPGLDGFGVLRELRADALTRDVPVVLLSARAGEEAAVEGLQAGADDYLVKPFSTRELLARVRTHVQLNRVRREWTRELERVNKELESFSYSVSHDLRAPLRSIDGFSKMLLADFGSRLDDQGRHYLDRVRSAAQRMGALIDDLLALSRVGREPLRKQPIDLTGLAMRVVDDLRRREPERTVAVEIGSGLLTEGDPNLVTIALENLLGNAWKFTGKRDCPVITIGRRQTSGETAFFVSDNGAGFDMTYAERLFTPFQRMHSASEFEGTGIGLATVQRIISRHGGRIWAESAVGAGATFLFTLGCEP